MKKTSKIAALIGALILGLVPTLTAQAGNEGAHGGDPYALEFTTLGQAISQALPAFSSTRADLFKKWNFAPPQFSNTVANTRIVSDEGDQVVLRGSVVDAINYPDQSQILVNRARWREDDLHSRIQLVLHEYFGILGVERDRFDASIDFAEFTTSIAAQIQAQTPSTEFMANLFYGQCVSFPPLTDPSTCGQGTDALNQAITCAQSQAEGRCRLSGKTSCDLVSTTFTPQIKTDPIGVRYCEVLTLMF